MNNVMYNWGSECVHTVQSNDNMYMNMVNNMFIAGPSTSSSAAKIVFKEETDQSFASRMARPGLHLRFGQYDR